MEVALERIQKRVREAKGLAVAVSYGLIGYAVRGRWQGLLTQEVLASRALKPCCGTGREQTSAR